MRFALALLTTAAAMVATASAKAMPESWWADPCNRDSQPTANAGPDLHVRGFQTVMLNGLDSYDAEDKSLQYAWELRTSPQDSHVRREDLHDATSAKPWFQPDVEGFYVVWLAVTDFCGHSSSDFVQIYVACDPRPEVKIIDNFRAGVVGENVCFEGEINMVEPSKQYSDIFYHWEFASVPTTSSVRDSSIRNLDTMTPCFSPDMAGTYVLKLVARDDCHDTVATTEIEICGASQEACTATRHSDKCANNTPPKAAYVEDYDGGVAPDAQSVTLDASASSDADGDELDYTFTFWSVPHGSGIRNSDIHTNASNNAIATFKPDRRGYYRAKVTVKDACGAKDSAIVEVAALNCHCANLTEVCAGNGDPVAHAGRDRTDIFGVQDTYRLEGSRTSDPDVYDRLMPLLARWTVVSVPEGSNFDSSGIEKRHELNTHFTPDIGGIYEFKLEASDRCATSIAYVKINICDSDDCRYNFEGTSLLGNKKSTHTSELEVHGNARGLIIPRRLHEGPNVVALALMGVAAVGFVAAVSLLVVSFRRRRTQQNPLLQTIEL